MIVMIRDWLHGLHCQLTGCPLPHEISDAQEARIQVSEERLVRVEDKIDQMIIRRAGSDFLEDAMTNREADRGR